MRRAALVLPQVLFQALMPKDSREIEKRRGKGEMETETRKLGLEFTFIELPQDVSPEGLVHALRESRIDIAEISATWASRWREFWAPLAASGISASGVGAASARDGALLSGYSSGWFQSAVRLAARVVRGSWLHRSPGGAFNAIPVLRQPEHRPYPGDQGAAIDAGASQRGVREHLEIPQSVLLRADG